MLRDCLHLVGTQTAYILEEVTTGNERALVPTLQITRGGVSSNQQDRRTKYKKQKTKKIECKDFEGGAYRAKKEGAYFVIDIINKNRGD